MPAHDCYTRVFARLDADQFERCFLSWVKTIAEITTGEVIAIDGKMLRRSHDGTLGKSAIHMVSAWATSNRLVLAQEQVDEKSNEITAIPRLLALLDLHGCVVTIDAMGCQKKIAQQIVDQGGDYVLALKQNQGKLHERTQLLFAHAETHDGELQTVRDQVVTSEKGHGRIEKRTCQVVEVDGWGFYLDEKEAWPGLCTVIKVTRELPFDSEQCPETRYFISSLPSDAEMLLTVVRRHWGVENGLHWVLDMAFREDESRVRKGNGPHNFSLLRRLALNLLQREDTLKVGIKNKRLRAGWDSAFLAKVLSGA